MIFAELQPERDDVEFHGELAAFLAGRFPGTRAGLQCDSWVWICDGKTKVAVDTFTSRHHQIKAAAAGSLVEQVILALAEKYPLERFSPPLLEEHEEAPDDS